MNNWRLGEEINRMTEFEYIEGIMMLEELAAYHSMNFIALLFSYVVVAYFAGPRISSVQIWLVSLVYSSILFAPVTANLRALENLQRLGEEFSAQFPDSAVQHALGEERVYVLFAVYFAAWLLSILFMYQWRRQHGTVPLEL
jgi:hypothetical protein